MSALSKAETDRFDWTSARLKIRRAMLGSGSTHAEIAEALGTTRDVVAKQAHNERGPTRSAGEAWTDERTDRLRELWAAGFSSSQIGDRLGVTKNSAIGKIHRLGLAPRRVARGQTPAHKPRPSAAPTAKREPSTPVVSVALLSPVTVQFSAAISARVLATAAVDCVAELPDQVPATPRPETPMEKPAPARVETPAHADPAPVAPLAVVPRIEETQRPAGGCDLLSLKDHMCRWPIGDPRADDFHFCGQRRAEGFPYCETHTRIGYQPMQRRRQAQTTPQNTRVA